MKTGKNKSTQSDIFSEKKHNFSKIFQKQKKNYRYVYELLFESFIGLLIMASQMFVIRPIC